MVSDSDELLIQTLDFLNNCCQTQKKFFQKLMALQDPSNDQANSNELLLSGLQKLMKRLEYQQGSLSSSVSAEFRTIQRKLGCLVYQVLSDEYLSTALRMKFWKLLFPAAIQMVIRDFNVESSHFVDSVLGFTDQVKSIVQANVKCEE